MYLIDTNIVGEARKRRQANRGVRRFFEEAQADAESIYVSVITIGEIRRGVEIIRYRGDAQQARRLEIWLELILKEYDEHIIDFGYDESQVWGRLRVPHPENAIDKQIAATALTHDLTLVTRNTSHFEGLGVPLLNPFD
ncbi:MAG TPA: type II toxin-antitoxin system VapC family toxin [Candidatus Binatia bacterium]|nr:type II toxin-antitoxin system VapC family toxin [Candidatus Binatia bacterium]